MKYYMIEWDHEEPDEPSELYLEIDDRGLLRRRIEGYRAGLYERFILPEPQAADPHQLAGENGVLSALNASQFDHVWFESGELPSSFMGAF